MRDDPKKSSKSEIGDDNHYAKKQHDRIEIDRLIGFFKRQHAGGNHQTGAKQGRPSPVNSVYGYLAKSYDGVGCKKDQPCGDDCRVRHPAHSAIKPLHSDQGKMQARAPQKTDISPRVRRRLSALGQKADMCVATRDVRFGPKADMSCVCLSTSRAGAGSSEPRSRPCGSRQGREAVGTAWGHGCCRSRLWSPPCVSPRSVADRDGRYDLWWPRCTSWASSSTRHLRASDRKGPPPALPALHRRTSVPPQANLPQSRGHRWP